MKKILSFLIFTCAFVFIVGVMPLYAEANTFIPTQAQLDRAKTIEGFDFDIFYKYLPDMPHDYDFDQFLDLMEEFDLVMQEHPDYVEPIVIDGIDELRDQLEAFNNLEFISVEDYEEDKDINELDTRRTTTRDASRSWSVQGAFIGPKPRAELFVNYTSSHSNAWWGDIELI